VLAREVYNNVYMIAENRKKITQPLQLRRCVIPIHFADPLVLQVDQSD